MDGGIIIKTLRVKACKTYIRHWRAAKEQKFTQQVEFLQLAGFLGK